MTPPTIGAAIRHHVATHPGERDMVQLRRGGKRRPKLDHAKIAQEVRPLWEAGTSKEALARKHECSATTIANALKQSYRDEGASMPSQSELRQRAIAEARRLHDAGTSQEEIARALRTCVITVRTYLRESFKAEGMQMPDLRRRRTH
jgi:DNA invertase Pin-like site-specific DNA recombinase